MEKSELAEKIKKGELSIDDSMDFFNVLCEVSNENKEIQDEVKGWDKNLLFDIINGPRMTLIVQGSKFKVIDGEQGTPDITLSMNSDIAVGVLSGKIEATSAYMAGDLKVKGQLPDAIKFRTLIELMLEALEN